MTRPEAAGCGARLTPMTPDGRWHSDCARVHLMGRTFRIASVAGIPIDIHPSWLAIYALISWSLAVGYFPAAIPDVPVLAYWVSGLVAALLLFVAVLAHELSHAFVARAYGLTVRGITLHVFGGVSHLEDEPPSPRAEFLIAAAGPLTSFAAAGLVWAIRAAGVFGPVGQAIATYLVFVNVAVGVFNLVPGFPLDGGRLLRAALWAWHGTLERATYWASRVGVGFAFALMALGVVQILNGSFVGGVWLVLLGLFLRGAADGSYSQMALHSALGRVTVRDVMSAPVVTVPPDATIARMAEDLWVHRFTSFPVVDGGVVRGLVTLDHVRGTPRDQWTSRRVADAMRPLSDDLVVRPGGSALEALRKTASNGIGRVAVLDDGRLVGYVALKDIAHLLALKGVPAGAESLSRTPPQDRTASGARRAA